MFILGLSGDSWRLRQELDLVVRRIRSGNRFWTAFKLGREVWRCIVWIWVSTLNLILGRRGLGCLLIMLFIRLYVLDVVVDLCCERESFLSHVRLEEVGDIICLNDGVFRHEMVDDALHFINLMSSPKVMLRCCTSCTFNGSWFSYCCFENLIHTLCRTQISWRYLCLAIVY